MDKDACGTCRNKNRCIETEQDVSVPELQEEKRTCTAATVVGPETKTIHPYYKGKFGGMQDVNEDQ